MSGYVCSIASRRTSRRSVQVYWLSSGMPGNLWFLRFLTSASTLPKLARLRHSSLLKVPGVGVKYAGMIQ